VVAEPPELAARLERASARLAVAVRLELNCFVTTAVESRLRARPNFLARTPQAALVGLRARVDDDANRAAIALERPVADLRVYYGAETRTPDEEDRGFGKTVAEAAQQWATRVLAELAFPGDDKPDRADVTQVDLDATYQVTFTPSPTLLWAWRQVRELDGVRNRLADGGAPDFETRWHLPEH